MLTKQFFYFVISGGIAATLNWASRFLFSEVFSFEVAVALAYVVGMISAFILMRVFVFDGVRKPIAPQVGKFIAVNLIALLQTLVISMLLARWVLPYMGVTQYAEAIGHFVGVLVPVFTSYIGHKRFSFN